jgi:hypothetical protein
VGLDRVLSADLSLGWAAVKPSAQAIRAALAEVAAELKDAGRVDVGAALRATHLYPTMEVELLRHRPQRRPAAVLAFTVLDARHDLHRHPLEGLAAGAPARLAREHEGWAVLGELTEISILDRLGHHERRLSGLVRGPALDRELHPHFPCQPLTIENYAFLGRNGEVPLGIMSVPAHPAGTPSGWLAFHPRLAGSSGFSLSAQGLAGWELEGRPAVRSIWWRSGFRCWNAHPDTNEVGEGWLVLGSPEVASRLAEEGWRLSWQMRSAHQGDGDTPAAEVRSHGEQELCRGPVSR